MQNVINQLGNSITIFRLPKVLRLRLYKVNCRYKEIGHDGPNLNLKGMEMYFPLIAIFLYSEVI